MNNKQKNKIASTNEHVMTCVHYYNLLTAIFEQISVCYNIDVRQVHIIYKEHSCSIDKTISIIDTAFHLNQKIKEK